MTLSRRDLLGSLTLGSVWGTFGKANAMTLQAAVDTKEQSPEIFWRISSPIPSSGFGHFDFWSKLQPEICYAPQLPSAIGRGTLERKREAMDTPGIPALADQSDDRFSIRCGVGINCLTKFLRRKLDTNTESKQAKLTTALIALDSQLANPTKLEWADILPEFHSCYDRIIGHYHISQRGFHHWKNWMKESSSNLSSFEHIFTRVASRCDTIIFTSQSLIENDVHLSARTPPKLSLASWCGDLRKRY
jgi:hypothetical protein